MIKKEETQDHFGLKVWIHVMVRFYCVDSAHIYSIYKVNTHDFQLIFAICTYRVSTLSASSMTMHVEVFF
jgi:hypothetical protein